MSALQKEIIKSKLPSGLPSSSKLMQNRNFGRKRDYEPVSWMEYFSERKYVTIGDDQFCYYMKGDTGPILILLHGGGFSALTWALFTKHITSLVTCQILAIDLRGHGNTKTKMDDDLSIETLSSDVAKIIQSLEISEPIVIAGHSLGGAVAVRAEPLLENVAGVVVIDVVEGTAMDALKSMQFFLRSRPLSFSSIPQAIEWSVRSGQIKNAQSAKVSVPGQIKNIETGKLGTDDTDAPAQSTENKEPPFMNSSPNSIIEEDSTMSSAPQDSTNKLKASKYTWRINLEETEKHWNGWFHGLSSAFLNISAPKVLLLAGVDRLDKELTVGQMQGKFQLQVLSACGHAVQEDAPEKVAEAIATFLVRHKFAEPLSDFSWSVPAC